MSKADRKSRAIGQVATGLTGLNRSRRRRSLPHCRRAIVGYGAIAFMRLHVKVIELSGGNQQKLVIAKSLVQEPDVIIFDEPTRGVDVGAISEIHAEINRLADAGKAVVVISSYLPEALALSDRILVAKQGKVVVEFSATEATQEGIMYAAIH
jgi:ABC-type sugar transport system ATPase subunit